MALYNPPPNMIDGLTVPIPPLPSPTSSTENAVTQASNSLVSQGGRVHVNNVKFRAKPGYYYSKVPVANLNFPGGENYIVTTISELRNKYGRVVEKELGIYYNSNGFDVLEGDGHNITFTHKVAKEIDNSNKVKEIRNLSVDTSSIDSNGKSRNISISGTPGSIFSLTIKDKNNRNILPYSKSISKIVKTAITTSNTLELNHATNLEVGMLLLNNQRRNVKITGIGQAIKTNTDTENESLTTIISISKSLTFSADDTVNFVKEGELTEVTIPKSGIYSFKQNFPALEKFTRTLKTAASATTSLTLDYTKDLEDDMKITGTGVDGNDPVISSNGVDPDGVTITVSGSQTIDDETELTFEMPDNRYDITLYPINALVGDNIPKYSSDDCDILPAYSIYQYIDPIVQIVPSSALSNVTVDGTVSFTGKANSIAGSNGDITINMTATKSDGSLVISRDPLFSNINSTLSDFSNTINTTTKTVRNDACKDRDIVHLNNTTGIRVGMVITGNGINTNKTITVKSITGTAVKLSEKQTIEKGDNLLFSSMYNINISGLEATLSANGGLATGICTVTGTGSIEVFGIDSFTSTFDFDNFLSIAT